MTTITIDNAILEQAIDALAGYRRELGDSQPCDAEQELCAALAAQPSNYSDWQQRRGVLADIVDEALASYEAWMAEDDYNATDALHKIMDHMRQRAASYAKPAQQPAPAWHDAPEREAFDALIKDAEHIHVPSAEKAWKAACAWQKRKDEAICAGFSQEAYNRYRASRREYDDGQCDAANALADKIRGVE